MRNAETVYLVGMAESGSHQGSTTVTMRLLRGNQVLEVDDVLYVETDQESLDAAWDENLEMLGERGVRLLEVTEGEADEIYLLRQDEDEDEEEGPEILEEVTETGWRLSVEGEGVAEVVGNAEAGSWSTPHASGTYEAFDDGQGERRVRFLMADGTVADIVRAGEGCFREAWLWGLGRG